MGNKYDYDHRSPTDKHEYYDKYRKTIDDIIEQVRVKIQAEPSFKAPHTAMLDAISMLRMLKARGPDE